MNSSYFWIVLVFSICGIVGLIFYLIRRKRKNRERIENILRCILNKSIEENEKAKKITRNRKIYEKFNIDDLLCNMLDVVYMLQELKENEFYYVDKVFMAVNSKYDGNYLDFEKYNKLFKEIALDFDMVVPYYKICQEGCPIVRYNDMGKEEYREKARILIDNGLIFSEQWRQLKIEFYNKFYAIYDT